MNDSKEVVATLYLTSIILVVVLAITIFLDEYVNVYAAGYSFGITLSTVVMLGVVFLSKVSNCSKNSERQNYMYVARYIVGGTGKFMAITFHNDKGLGMYELKNVIESKVFFTLVY